MLDRTILLADNDLDFLDICTEFLESAGYAVLKAPQLGEARRVLEESWVHLAIIDLRLVSDEDEKDVSGLTLVKESNTSVPRIMLTRFQTWEAVRESLGVAISGNPPAIDFVAKQEGLDELLRRVRRAFARHVRINWDLLVDWNEIHLLSFPHLTGLIESDLPKERLSDRSDELEDLFRRLFYEKTQITIGRLLWQRQGRIAVTVFAFAPGKPSESLVVICGPPAPIRAEVERYERLAPAISRDTGGATLSALRGLAETTHFAAYALAGPPLENFQTLAEFYHSNPDLRSFRGVVDSLQGTLAVWHRGQRVPAEHDASEPQLFREKTGLRELGRSGLEERVSALQTEAAAHGIKFDLKSDSLNLHLAGGHTLSYSNPLPYVYALPEEASAASCVIAPGTLTPSNILITQEGRAWLTDFADVGPAPSLWNFTELEAAIRFDLVESDDLTGLHEMERRLTEPGRIGKLDSRDVDRPIRMALQSVEAIRRAAAHLVDQDARSYHIGLLFQAMGRVAAFQSNTRRTRGAVVPVLHALLAAGMICERILKSDPLDSPDKPTGIRMDSNRRVFVEGKEIHLPSTEYKLLEYFYNNAGQLCTRRNVFKHVWDEEYEPGNASHNHRLDVSVGRLRNELGPDSDRYLVTKRGDGYYFYREPRR